MGGSVCSQPLKKKAVTTTFEEVKSLASFLIVKEAFSLWLTIPTKSLVMRTGSPAEEIEVSEHVVEPGVEGRRLRGGHTHEVEVHLAKVRQQDDEKTWGRGCAKD